jgi:N-acetylglucosamine kinase-like BadF-type ATPase
MSYLLGLDGGGTKTKAVLATEDGQIVCGVQAGISNFQRVGVEGIKKVCLEISAQLEKQMQVTFKDIGCWTLGLAGAGRQDDQLAVKKAVESLGYTDQVLVQSDAFIALMGAFCGFPGVIIIAGTGSICFGLDEKNQIHRSGGWGYLLGDEGSGYFIGHQALLAALKDFDGRGEKTELLENIVSTIGLSSLDQIVRKIYIENSFQKEDIASLAPLVFECAAQKDIVAQKIISNTGKEMAKMIVAVGKKMRKTKKKIQVATIGSVFKQKHVLIPIIKKNLENHFTDVDIGDPFFEPAIGGIIWAMKEKSIPINERIKDNLKKAYEMV